jgi:uridine kinase
MPNCNTEPTIEQQEDEEEKGIQGGPSPELICTDVRIPPGISGKPKMAEDAVVEELNKKHAVVHTDQFYILTEKSNPKHPNQIDFSLESRQSLINLYENQVVKISEKEWKSKAKIWLSSPLRRTYLRIVFDPTNNNDAYYNVWKGFAFNPKKGICELYKTHIKDGICNGNVEHFAYVWKWMAHLIQHPDKIGTALLLMGSQGTGKGSFAKHLGRLLGQHFIHLDNLEQVVGNFNYHLRNAVLVFADEAIWGGNKKDIGRVKAMITEETAIIEQKGKDPIELPNFRHFIFSSN